MQSVQYIYIHIYTTRIGPIYGALSFQATEGTIRTATETGKCGERGVHMCARVLEQQTKERIEHTGKKKLTHYSVYMQLTKKQQPAPLKQTKKRKEMKTNTKTNLRMKYT